MDKGTNSTADRAAEQRAAIEAQTNEGGMTADQRLVAGTYDLPGGKGAEYVEQGADYGDPAEADGEVGQDKAKPIPGTRPEDRGLK